MALGGIIAVYVLGTLIAAYLFGRFGRSDMVGLAIMWPILLAGAVLLMPLLAVADLGERK